ncbi:portal protein [Microvirga lotononidis]|uniref:Portal protein n=1 Tax=Microvirga lotononidis TaxID=864069 RepID=I4YP50_9HYPH|nr:hypothetical protein [Microvirga lotononidis]EIM25742.1 hypothetical protein MicloDRAFT_00064690 [Microvirga lotononidis]WQO25671.1 hypothetical protein U0023_13185 [Microvirga lotononidis]
MAKQRKKMSESELSALLDGQIADAVSYEESELASLRDKALKYREGIMDDLPAEEGKSSVVSMDVNDTISWIKPGLMRIFANSDRVVEFEPKGPGDEEYAHQATDYINYLFLKECRGYKVLLTAFDDALGLGNGVIMHWWDKTPCYEVETFTGLSDDAFTLLVSDDDVEVLEHTEYADASGTYAAAEPNAQLLAATQPVPGLVPGADGGQGASSVGMEPGVGGPGPVAALPAPVAPEPSLLHDVKIKRTVRTGRLRLEALPPEELLIPRDAKAIDEEISGIGRERIVTRSTLVKEGYDRAIVDALPAHSEGVDDSAKNARDSKRTWEGNANPDKSMEKVCIYEWYPLVDYDGDGVAERRFVVIGDRSENEARKILLNEEWGDALPFTDLTPNPVAHRRRGRSIFDETQDIQRINTALSRAIQNNTYHVNEPMIEAVQEEVINHDALVNRELGGVIWVKRPGMIQANVTPPIFDKILPVIEYWNGVKQGRTGVGRQTMGLEPDALQNQTAEAVRDGRAASETQTEFYARNMAEIDFQRLFSCILKLVVKNQDRPKVIRLRDKWVEMDPRPWNADMDCTINVGLGAGSKDRDMVMLQAIAGKQEIILQTLGPDNPLCSLSEYRQTLAEMVEVGGLRVAEKYFKEVTPEVLQQWMQAKSQQPDPKMMEAQAKLQIEQAKAEQNAQIESQKAQQTAQIEAMRLENDLTLKREQLAAEIQLKERQLVSELQLKREQMAAEMQIKREMGVMNAQVSVATSKVSMGGEPG